MEWCDAIMEQAAETSITRDQIIAMVRQHRSELRLAGVDRIGLFGSYARNEQHINSDVDFLVEFLPVKKTFTNFMKVWDNLESVVNRPVDIITLESLASRPHLQQLVLNDAKFITLD